MLSRGSPGDTGAGGAPVLGLRDACGERRHLLAGRRPRQGRRSRQRLPGGGPGARRTERHPRPASHAAGGGAVRRVHLGRLGSFGALAGWRERHARSAAEAHHSRGAVHAQSRRRSGRGAGAAATEPARGRARDRDRSPRRGRERRAADRAGGRRQAADRRVELPVARPGDAADRHLPGKSALRRDRLALPARVLDPRLARPDRRARHHALDPAMVAGPLGRPARRRRLRPRSRAALSRRGRRAGDEARAQRGHAFPVRAGRIGGDAVLSWAATALEYLVFWLLLPFLLLHPPVRQGIRSRFGFYGGVPALPPGPRVWLHGASAGDVLGLVPIVRELKALRPDARVIVSAITDSGASMARQRLVPQGLAELVTFLPYDLPGACRRAMAALRPDVLVIEYTELWPQLIRTASEAGVKLALTNGRLRPRNVPRYRLLFRLAGNLLAKFDVLMMRADDEAERALLLGAPRERVHVTGNTKFDALAVSVPEQEDASLRQALALGPERLWVCGSTHEGEESGLLRVFAVLQKEHPDLRLLIAPRYIERAQRVLGLARSLGLRARLRSEPGGPEPVIVLDTIGELVRAYSSPRWC